MVAFVVSTQLNITLLRAVLIMNAARVLYIYTAVTFGFICQMSFLFLSIHTYLNM